MNSLSNLIITVIMLILFKNAFGQHQEQKYFLSEKKDPLQNYIMVGREKGWQDCDILSENSFYNQVSQISMDLEKVKSLKATNIKSIFASAHCLLVNYQINSEASLSAIMDFGRAAIQHIRLAMIIHLKSGITLNMMKNATKIPFPVAAQLDNGEEFLCPVVGELVPRIDKNLCKTSYVSYKYKTLRIALIGPMPDFIFTPRDGKIEGTGIRLIRMLAQRLKFMPKIQVPSSLNAPVSLVCHKS